MRPGKESMMMQANEITRGGGDYVGYDYKTVTVAGDKFSMYLDAYGNFGWAPDEAADRLMHRRVPAGSVRGLARHFAPGAQGRQYAGAVILKMKRDRKILNKAELTRLTQHFEACMDEIGALENAKTGGATALSIVLGVIGTALLAGSVFAVTHEPPMVLLCGLLGLPGIAGWALPYPVYKRLVIKKAEKLDPLIERKYDDVHEICGKGNALLH